jgi:copper oxidase (laccase) domain-containing protein
MQSAFGSDPSDLLAGLGPAIGPCCYEVGEDVARRVREAFPGVVPQLLTSCGEKYRLDLWTANRYHLERAGVRCVEVSGTCTACHTGEWFSHRAEQGRTGRIGALIGLRG